MVKAFLVSALMIASVAACGGSDGGDMITEITEITEVTEIADLIESLFPGPLASANYHSPDSTAFIWTVQDAPGSDFEVDKMVCFTDSQSRAAVLAWHHVDEDDDFMTAHVSYTSGDGLFTPPVVVPHPRMEEDDTFEGFAGAVFLNTADFSASDATGNAAAQARSGDVILLYRSIQLGDPTVANDTDTSALFSVYFDSSAQSTYRTTVTDAQSGSPMEFRYGWQMVATRVDNDPDSVAVMNPTTRFNVDRAGLVSDSTVGSHNIRNGVTVGSRSSGDPTTFVYAVYRQAEDGLPARWRAKQFDLTTANAYSFPSTETALGIAGAVGPAGVNEAIAHNGVFVFEATDTNGESLHYFRFGPTLTNTTSQRFTNTDASPGLITAHDARNFYGPDHGLPAGRYVLGYSEEGFDGDSSATVGFQAADNDLYVTSFDTSTDTVVAPGIEIDEFTGIRPGGAADVAGVTLVDSRIARDASYVCFSFRQDSTDDNATAADARNLILKAVVVDPTRMVDDVASPISNVLPLAPAILNSADIQNPEFQAELVGGLQGPSWRGIQSNVRRMSLLYNQENDESIADETNDLRVAGISVTTLDAAMSATPVIAIPADFPLQVVESIDEDYPTSAEARTLTAVAYDNGDNGKVNVFYMAQTENQTDNTVTGIAEPRAFHWHDGASTVLSDDAFVDPQELHINEVLDVVTTPRPTGLDATSPNYAGSYSHIVWVQKSMGSSQFHQPPAHIRHNAWNKTSGDASVHALLSPEGGAHVNRDHGLLTVNYEMSDEPIRLGTNGDQLEIYFEEGGSLFWQQWTPGSGWIQETTGAPDPQLINNENNAVEIDMSSDGYKAFLDLDGTSSSPDDSLGTIVVWEWLVDDTTSSGAARGQVRMRTP